MTKPIRVPVVLHRRLKAHAALLGLGLGEYVETALWEALVDAPPTRVAEADGAEVTDGPVRYAESEA